MVMVQPEQDLMMTRDDQMRGDAAKARLACHLAAFVSGQRDDLLSDRRGTVKAAHARQMAMYLTHVAFGMSLHRVAVAFGRDRSTVAHACHLMEDRRDDPAFDALMEAMETSLRAAPAPEPLAFAA